MSAEGVAADAFILIIFSLLGILIAASAAITSALTYHYGWGPIDQGFSEKDYGEWLYIKPWNRFGPYVIGILLGYILHSTKSRPFKMSKVVQSLRDKQQSFIISNSSHRLQMPGAGVLQ